MVGAISRTRAISAGYVAPTTRPIWPLLIPGIGAQGGDAAATVRAGWRGDAERTTGPIIVSSSRAILYAGSDEATYGDAARRAAEAARAELAAAQRG